MTPELQTVSIAMAGGAAALLFAWWLVRLARRRLKRLNERSLVTDVFWSSRPDEPGWTEALGGDGRLRYGRAFSVNNSLMEVDAMARRGELDAKGD